MNNYTVDVSIFLLDENDFNNASEREKGTIVKKVCRAIDRYKILSYSLNNSVFFSEFDKEEILQKLEKNAFRKKEYQKEIKELLNDDYEYQDYKNSLNNFIEFFKMEPDEFQADWRQDFQNQFDIQGISLDDIYLIDEPNNKILETYGQNFIKTLSSIALLNQYIYNDYTKHLFLYRGLKQYEELRINAQIKHIFFENDELSEIIKNQKEITGTVKKKSIKSITKTEKKFDTLEDAVSAAQSEFSNLIFGNDVQSGVKESDKRAGPPDKVYYYLKTLNDITEIKKNIPSEISPVLLARMYGCNCSSESGGLQEDESLIQQRTFDDGYGGKTVCIDHLKLDERDSQKIRIHFKWDNDTKITFVGWIGKHLQTQKVSLPPG
jgi:hypothetical protein